MPIIDIVQSIVNQRRRNGR